MNNDIRLKVKDNASPVTESCPICFHSAPINFRQINGFEVWKCTCCQLLWVPNVDEKILREFYDAEYFKSSGAIFGYHNYLEDEKILRLNARYILANLPKFNGIPSKILDIGCAHGFLMDEARKLSWEPYGVELSQEAVNYAVNHLRLKVFQGSVLRADFSDNMFDYVTILGVLEHLQDPVRVIRETQRMLKPSGYLAITTIDTNALMKLFKVKLPEHLYYFSAHNLSTLLHSCGYEVIKIVPYWCHYHLSEALCRAFRLIFRSGKRIEKYLESVPFLKINMKVPTNEMFVLCRKK